MARTEFRLFFDGRPATREQLDTVEEISVEQEMDLAWEARITLPVRADERGRWADEGQPFMQPFARIRAEIRVAGGRWVPLIDGPVVGHDSERSSEPGRSTLILIVHDDSVLLNREDLVERFDAPPDEVARRLFATVQEIDPSGIEAPPGGFGEPPPPTVQRGTAMQLLRHLARQFEVHAYVLPGAEPGRSIGNFRSLPRAGGSLPPLVLLGRERNIESFSLNVDAQRPARVQAFSLNITDKQVVSARSSFRDLELLGSAPPLEREEQAATRLAPPASGAAASPEARATALARRTSRAIEARGSVLECYPGVLRPYELVSVAAVDERSVGRYVVQRVTHTLSRSAYAQNFALIRDARSQGAEAEVSDLIGRIF